eukprot:1157521-Pelagomonas_calceolata.AAC.2
MQAAGCQVGLGWILMGNQMDILEEVQAAEWCKQPGAWRAQRHWACGPQVYLKKPSMKQAAQLQRQHQVAWVGRISGPLGRKKLDLSAGALSGRSKESSDLEVLCCVRLRFLALLVAQCFTRTHMHDLTICVLQPNLVTFNTLIDVYGKLNKWTEAVRVVNNMRAMGIEPVIRTYNTLMIACNSSNQWQESLRVYQQVGAGSEVPVTVLAASAVRDCSWWSQGCGLTLPPSMPS